MSVTLYAALGNNICDSWGICGNNAEDVKVNNLQTDVKMLCVLTAILKALHDTRKTQHRVEEQLEAANRHLIALRSTVTGRAQPKSAEYEASRAPDAIADGMLQWLCGGNGDSRITDMDKTRLSVRAVGALERSGIRMRSQITEESLMGVWNCGETTIRELLSWAGTARINNNQLKESTSESYG